MTLSRRAVLGATAATGLAGATSRFARAASDSFKYKYANNLPLTHPMNVRAQEAVEAIKKESQGRLVIEIFPNNQLGSDTDMLSQVRSGAIDFFTLSGLILSTLVPVASINGIGFAFPDYPTVWKAMDGELGATIRAAIDKHGLYAFDKIWDNGFREITTSTKPINSPADLAGFKIRVPVSPLWTSMFRAFGAAPTSINFSEVYSALQTHIVDGQENPLAIIETGKLYEVQKYCSLTNHMWDGFWFLANQRSWRRLPAELRDIAAKNFNDAAIAERADVAKLNATLAGKLKDQGMAFNQPDPAPFRQKLKSAGFYAEWEKRYGAHDWSILEKAVGSLA